MTRDTQEYDIKTIRELLLAAFTPDDLRRFCHDRQDFRVVVRRFGPGDGLDAMVDQLITYCENFLLFPELLAELKQHNPRQYNRFFGSQLPAVEVEEPQEEQSAEPTPEIPTSSDPPKRETKRSLEDASVRPAAEASAVTTAPVVQIKKPPDDEPAPPIPEIPTVTSPIKLDLVRVPAGEFQMGSVMVRDKHALDDELPPHPIHLPDFYIGQCPVTNLQYQVFVQATGRQAPDHWKEGRIPPGKENHPVIHVSWFDAFAFCEWLARETRQPFRLPSEAEWEKAARGTDGRIYPWGDDPPDEGWCNFGKWMGWFVTKTKPVGSYSPHGDSPYGCADMAGNVNEWCQSRYWPYPYRADDGREDPQAEEDLEAVEDFDLLCCVTRGGSYYHGPRDLRCARRFESDPYNSNNFSGFRVARGPLG